MLLNHLRTPHGDSLIKQNVFTSFQEEQEEEEASPAEREGERFGCQKRTSPEHGWLKGCGWLRKHKPESCSEAPSSLRAGEHATLQFLKGVKILKK